MDISKFSILQLVGFFCNCFVSYLADIFIEFRNSNMFTTFSFLCCFQGMHMGLGGNPYGPAGTGKTESVKALGGLFGRQVLVFNCDEGIDVKSMGRIFVGLVKCGAWGCFDEFNRLEEAVLSAVSMQIQTIQAALKSQAATTTLLEKEVKMWTLCRASNIFC